MRVVVALVCVAGCGRIGFDATGDGDIDPADWMPTAPPSPFVKFLASPGYEWAYDVGTMDNGDAVVAFSLLDSIDLGGGMVVANGLTFAAARYRADGTHLWSKSVTSTSAIMSGRTVATRGARASFGGYFGGMATLDGGATVTAAAGQNFIVLEANTAGVLDPVAYAGGTDGLNTQAYAIAEGNDGSRAVGGVYGTSVQLSPSLSLPAPVDTDDGYVVMLDPAGVPRWAKSYAAPGNTYVFGVAIDGSGNVCVVGRFASTLSTEGRMLTTPGAEGGFIAVYRADGTLVSVAALDGSMYANATQAVGLPSGGFIVAGYASGTATLGSKTTTTNSSDFVLAKVDAAGSPLWLRAHGGSGDELAPVIARAPNGQIVLAGTFSAPMTIAGTQLNHVGAADMAYVTFDSDGNALRAWREGDLANELPLGVAVDAKSGDVVIVGIFELNPTVIGGQSWTPSNYDVFIQRFSPL